MIEILMVFYAWIALLTIIFAIYIIYKIIYYICQWISIWFS